MSGNRWTLALTRTLALLTMADLASAQASFQTEAKKSGERRRDDSRNGSAIAGQGRRDYRREGRSAIKNRKRCSKKPCPTPTLSASAHAGFVRLPEWRCRPPNGMISTKRRPSPPTRSSNVSQELDPIGVRLRLRPVRSSAGFLVDGLRRIFRPRIQRRIVVILRVLGGDFSGRDGGGGSVGGGGGGSGRARPVVGL